MPSDAIVAGDPSEAADRIQQHIEHAADVLVENAGRQGGGNLEEERHP